MDFAAEAQIARELMKFVANGLLYRGSKPVMWSVVEKTALAEAEVEYEDYTSDQIWVKFRIDQYLGDPGTVHDVVGASIVIWTTTPWTLPGNRAISYSPKIAYGLYEVVGAPDHNWAKVGDTAITSVTSDKPHTSTYSPRYASELVVRQAANAARPSDAANQRHLTRTDPTAGMPIAVPSSVTLPLSAPKKIIKPRLIRT